MRIRGLLAIATLLSATLFSGACKKKQPEPIEVAPKIEISVETASVRGRALVVPVTVTNNRQGAIRLTMVELRASQGGEKLCFDKGTVDKSISPGETTSVSVEMLNCPSAITRGDSASLEGSLVYKLPNGDQKTSKVMGTLSTSR